MKCESLIEPLIYEIISVKFAGVILSFSSWEKKTGKEIKKKDRQAYDL